MVYTCVASLKLVVTVEKLPLPVVVERPRTYHNFAFGDCRVGQQLLRQLHVVHLLLPSGP